MRAMEQVLLLTSRGNHEGNLKNSRNYLQSSPPGGARDLQACSTVDKSVAAHDPSILVGKMQTAISPRHRPSHVRPRDPELFAFPGRVARLCWRNNGRGYYLPPTVFRDGEFRFFFFSREESRMHIHVSHPDGEAKFWLEPTIELARNIGLNSSKTKEAERLVESHKKEITDAWNKHFKR